MKFETIYLISMVISLIVLEYFFPARKYKILNKHRLEDLLWLFIREVVYVFLLAGMMFKSSSFMKAIYFKNNLVLNLESQNIIIQCLFYFLILDFISYWSHRSLHTFKPLWGLHRLHHTTTELTALSVFRQSWGEAVFQGLFIGIFSGWITVSMPLQSYSYLLFVTACLIQHANIKFEIPEFVHNIIITPRNHLWHHSVEKFRREGQNFGLVLVVWDQVFKTLYNPVSTKTELGLSDNYIYSSFLSKIIYPLDVWPKKVAGKFMHKAYLFAQSFFGIFNRTFYQFLPLSPLVLRIRITNDCDLSCDYCFLKDNLNKVETNHLTLLEWEKLISKLPKRTIIDIAGAEPFKAKNFKAVLKMLLLRGFKVSLITNGQTLDSDIIRMLVENKLFYLMVSLDGLENGHNKARNSVLAFEKSVAFIREVQKVKKISKSKWPKICIKTSLLEHNREELLELQDFLFDDLGVDQQTLNLLFQNSARGGLALSENWQQVKKTGNTHSYRAEGHEDISLKLDQLINRAKSLGRAIEVKPPLRSADWEAYIKSPSDFGVKQCSKPYSIATLYFDGTLAPCDLAIKAGNIRELDFDMQRLWGSKSFQTFFQEFSREGSFKAVCEGCNLADQCKKTP